MTTKLMSKKEAARRVGLHPETIMRLVRSNQFVQPIRLGSTDQHSVRFVESEVQDWIEARMAERDCQTEMRNMS